MLSSWCRTARWDVFSNVAVNFAAMDGGSDGHLMAHHREALTTLRYFRVQSCMSDSNKQRQDYVSASIHKDFYFNHALDTPTLIKEYANVEKILLESDYMACITIQVPQLHRIEYQHGSQLYNKLLGDVTGLLKGIKDKEF